jgi:hypothetical protein
MRAMDQFHRGLYAGQLRRVLECFPRGQILVLQYERCVADPLSELRRTYAFLGLDPVDFVPSSIERHFNRTDVEKPNLSARTRNVLVDAYEPEMLELARIFPEVDLGLWPNFSHLASQVPT